MKLFVIGATGYIGSVVAEHLQKDGHELVGLARSQSSADQLEQSGIEPVRGEIGDVAVVSEQAKRADGVVQVSTGGFMQQAMLNSEPLVVNSAALIDALKGTNKPLIMTYGIAQYLDTGWIDPERIATEKDPRSWAYVYAHLETIQRMLEAEPTVRHIGIAPGGVYGRSGGYIGGFSRMFECIRRHGKLYGVEFADNAFSTVHVDDLADLYVKALRSPETRGLFIGSSEIVSSLDAARAVSKAAGLGGELEFVDYLTIRKQCGRYLEQDWWTNLRCSGQKAMDELGWRPSRRVEEDFASLPQPLDLQTVYPGPRRQAASAAATAAVGVAATGVTG